MFKSPFIRIKKPIKDPIKTGFDKVYSEIKDNKDNQDQSVVFLNEKIEKLGDLLERAIDGVEKNNEKIENLELETQSSIKEVKEEIKDELKKKLDEELNYEIDPSLIKGDKGEKGDNAQIDYDLIIKNVLEKIPKAEIPEIKNITDTLVIEKNNIDYKKITDDVVKFLQKDLVTDPMSVIQKIMELPEGKFKLKTKNIDGLEQTLSAFSNQLGKGYLHGGGDTVKAGAGIAVVTNSDGTKTISASSTAPQDVTLSYTGDNVTKVTLEDGTEFDLTYSGDTLSTVTDGTYTWSLNYTGDKLTSVTV